MVNVITELSKFVILLLMLLYTFFCYYVLTRDEQDKKHILWLQLLIIILMDLCAFAVIFMKRQNIQVMIIFAEMTGLFLVIRLVYLFAYKKASVLLLNNMFMLLSIGMIMITRLNMNLAVKQLYIAAGGSLVGLLIPFIMSRIPVRIYRQMKWLFAGFGIGLLAVVLVLGRTSFGAKLTLFGVQPSEVIKITFVFFMAAILSEGKNFRIVVIATAVAAAHVLILVASVDLGSAVIFFIAYLMLIYVGTRNVGYLALGAGGGSLAAVAGYYLFGHVRQRISAWRDPMSVYENEGYQVVQSLFAIGTGGWFGMGLCQGSPEKIPIVANDFIFSAVCEEMGGIFAICMILVCMSLFLRIVNIAAGMQKRFYKLIALGLGAEYAFQVFLTVGGATKFIPMTGVTLPLVSYGGSSVLSTIIMLAIIQGLYFLREEEDI